MATPVEPTPEEIRAECWRIQDGWTDDERRRRAGIYAEQERVVMAEVIVRKLEK